MNKRKLEYARVRMDSGQHRRIMIAAVLLGVLAFVPIAARLYQLMVTEYDYYSAVALKNQTRTTAVTGNRGTIYDRNMNMLAVSGAVENVYLAPRELRQAGMDLEAIAEELGRILEKDPQWIVTQGKDRALRYKQIAAGIDRETAARIRSYINEKDIVGIHLEPASKRYYPFGSLGAQVIGFVNASNTGSEGVEASWNSFLSAGVGKVVTLKGNHEIDMPDTYEQYLTSRPGCDVVLTLDATVQAALEAEMEAAIARYDVQNGAFGLVMDVDTGEILAMATLGSYDPNAYLEIADPDTALELELLRAGNADDYQKALNEARLKQWRNRVLSDGYEPGSTFKVLTLAAALDCSAVTLNSHFSCGGAEQIPGRSQLLHCWRSAGHGGQTTAQALQNSCNLAFAHIALALGGERFYDYVERFGVLEKTGIDLAGESKGVFFARTTVVDTQKWGTASLTSGSFGQTFKLTPLQLVRAISSVVNGGNLMEPYLISEILDSNGDAVYRAEPTAVRRTISEETSKIMCGLLESVVTEGTAKNAQVAGFSIGGKTGTSEKIDVLDADGRPTQDKIVSFVGIAPMDDPRYIVLVALDTPSRSTGIYISGGVMAAPTVGAVMARILPYLGVEHHYSEADLPGRIFQMPDLTAMTPGEVNKELKEMGLTARFIGDGAYVTAQIPTPGQSIPGGSQALVYLGEIPENEQVEVPDFRGMNRQQASLAAGKLGLYILVKGNPEISPQVTVTTQSLAPGTGVDKGTTIELEFTDTQAVD